VYLLRGSLPWQALSSEGDGNRVLMERKIATSPQDVCAGLPTLFADFVQEVRALQNRDQPDYDGYRRRFRALAAQEGIEYDNVFDWSILVYAQTRQEQLKQTVKSRKPRRL